jgi:hypothetical protein
MKIAAFFCFCFFSCWGAAQEIRPAPTDCASISDGYEWTPLKRPVNRVLWVQVLTERDFAVFCPAQAMACAWRFEGIAIVFARNPEFTYSEGFKHHEDCHTWGIHGEPPINGGLYR